MGEIVADANVLIRYLGKEIRATKVLEKLVAEGKRIFVPTIVIAEMLSYPKLTDEERMIIKGFISNFEIIPLDFSIAEIGGMLRSKYKIKLPDAIIAATAIYYNSPLLTFNVRDFKKIKELKIISP
jgi:predicted nucleic acid-binding protein